MSWGCGRKSVAFSCAPAVGLAPGRIEVVEPMGSVNHIVVALDGMSQVTLDADPFIAVVRSNEGFPQGAPVWIGVRPDRLVLFEHRSGKALAAVLSGQRWQSV